MSAWSPVGDLPAEIDLREVGPRDGLQPEQPVDVVARVAFVESLIDAGLRRIEAVAFVSPKAVPAMAGAAEVLAGIGRPEGVVLTALVPNLRGAEMALTAGIDELTVTISASETYNRRNVHMSIEESLAAIADIAASAAGERVPVDAVVSCAFGSPYEGDLSPAEVAGLCASLAERGVTSLTLADTTGMATPRRIADVLDAVGAPPTVAARRPGLHLHDSRGTALVNAYAGLQRGVRRFDTALGGLGGSPFAHGAGGNLATETIVALADDLGITTGVDLERLLLVVPDLEAMIGRPVPAPLARVGPRDRLSSAGS